MGVVLDTSVLIAQERQNGSVKHLLIRLSELYGNVKLVISTISVVELTHGMYRARTDADRDRRRLYVEEVFRNISIYPVTTNIARLAGQIEGEQARIGNVIAFEDLLIGATALHLGFQVATRNLRHFQRIPDLDVVIF